MAAVGPFAVLARRVALASRDRVVRSNAWWLYAQALEFLDADGVDTERALRRALEAAGDHVPAASDLAWHLDDRGRAGAALGLLVEHGLDDSGWAEALRGWAAPGPMSAGRNDPCPCGSGRKHKVCCATTNGWHLEARMDWVLQKLLRFASRPVRAGEVDETAARAGMASRDALPEDLAVASMCLFDGGLVAEFCDRRGPLLPADELDLLRGWEDAVAAAYEVVEVEPGRSMVLLDLTTGERHEVIERTASRDAQLGDVVLTWLVPYPDGSTRIALGGVQVPVQKRSSLLALLDRAPSAEDLAAWYASLFAPPRLHNTDGDPLLACRTLVDVPDLAAALDALAAVGDDAADLVDRPGATLDREDRAVHLLADTDSGRTLIGAIRVNHDHLVLEANSDVRMDGLQQLVLDRVEGATIVDDRRTPIGELVDGDGLDRDDDVALDGAGLPDDLDPDQRAEMIEALNGFMAQMEERWVDESIPALGGVTPREAAADPTRRGDLIALLDEFPPVETTPGRGRGMDPDRLRSLLGLLR